MGALDRYRLKDRISDACEYFSDQKRQISEEICLFVVTRTGFGPMLLP
jgi:hypothetical protein